MVTTLLDMVAVGLLGLDSIVTTISVYGVPRMPDVYGQLHAAGMASGVGAIAILLAWIATSDAGTITDAVIAFCCWGRSDIESRYRVGGLPSARLAEHAVGDRTPRPRIVMTIRPPGSTFAATDWR